MVPKIIITTHKNADFDGFAGCVAASLIYEDSIIVLEGEPQQNLKEFLNIYDIPYEKENNFIKEYQEEIKNRNFEKVVIVDTADINRIPDFIKSLVEQGTEVDIYDHHPELKEQNITGNNYSKEVGSATTLIVQKLLETKIVLPDTYETLFLIAIHEDTGNYVYSTTTPLDHQISAELLKGGARIEEVEEFVSLEMTKEQKELFDKLYNNVQELTLEEVTIQITYSEIDKFIGGLNVITHKLFETLTPDVLFVVVKMGKSIHIVARSRIEEIDLNKILSLFGGGGHKKAGSAKTKALGIQEVINKIKKELKSSFVPVLKAKHIMSSPVRTILSFETVEIAHELMFQTGHSGLPVISDNKLVGIVTKKDIEKAMKHGLKNAPVKAIMSTNLKVVDVETSLTQVRRIMAEADIGRIPVLKDGILVGIITRTDLLRATNGVFNFSLSPILEEKYKSQNLKEEMEKILPISILNLLKLIGLYGNELGLNVYVVGGFVRDLLLAINSKSNGTKSIPYDIDVVVEGDGLLFGKYVAKQLRAKYVEHPKFHTCSIFYRNGENKIIRIDIATARTEYYEEAGELPKVELSTIKKDLYRRDFSINAMAIKINSGSFGILMDFFNCKKDLEEGKIRILYPLSFIEDPTRILRAIRFEQRFGFEIEPNTLTKLEEAVENGYLEKVTGMRIREELEKILEEPQPMKAIKRMGKLKIILHLFEKTYYSPTLEKDLEKLFDVREYFKANLPNYLNKVRLFHIVLCVLLQYTPEESLKKITERYGLPKDFIKNLIQVKNVFNEISIDLNDKEKTSKLSYFYEKTNGFQNEQLIFLAVKLPEELLAKYYEYLRKIEKLKLSITGKDLLKKGYEGVQIKTKLEEIKKKLLNGEIQPGEEKNLI
ncbi:CBS domain containing protein [Petrotoga mobilis SJ95]|uniref:CBS domain containing protein n=1 Tax=Petrotoga mobilis (strain DSM 10674 / SJ95) TaxID=403833 RepID=A9BI97_PETMO|nr:CBS domain-containing protein [Petrotoga mobilis]ABX32388.1 CBS domain containing protein [Petrotoga mobilis SJ95]